MKTEEIITTLEDVGVLQKGHFRLTSGLHSDQYMQCAAVFRQPHHATRLVAEFLPQLPRDIDTVMAPAIGGITMGYELARQLGAGFVFAERVQGVMQLRRGFRVSKGERILLAEDVVTTGGSVKEVQAIAQAAGGLVKGVASLVDRSMGEASFGVPLYSLVAVDIQTYQPEECPLCARGVPIEKPGSRPDK